MSLVILPRQILVDQNGKPRVGARLWTYNALTNTPRVAYTTPAYEIPHTNPVLSVENGFFPAIYVDAAGGDYKIVITDLKDFPIWTEDNIPVRDRDFDVDLIGQLLNAITPAENSAGVTPSDYRFAAGDVRRYGADPMGVEDSTAAFQRATNTGAAVLIPEGIFRVARVTYTGKVTWIGRGTQSVILADNNILTVTNGTGSSIDNLYLENITAPWIITRNPANWLADAATLTATLQQSNDLGYQPTLNDKFWDGSALHSLYDTLTNLQKTQNIGPQLAFYGTGNNVEISRIYGRFVTLYVNGYSEISIHDCNFRAGKSVFGGIQIDNFSNGSAVGRNNRVFNNRISYASFSGVDFWNNEEFTVHGNTVFRCGESGIRTHAADGTPGLPFNFRGKVSNNYCYENYYDGLDMMAKYPVPDDVPETHHQVTDNYCYRNGGTGINTDGRYNQIARNYLSKNGRYGLWNYSSYSAITGNVLIDNNQERDSDWHEILLAGATGYNIVEGNYILGGVGQNNKGIYCFTNVPSFIGQNFGAGVVFDFGAAGTSVVVLGNNVDDPRGLLTEQCFIWIITNDAGTLKHSMRGGDASTAALTILVTRVSGASATATATPTGADTSTAFAAGGKISTVNTNYFVFDTDQQFSAYADMSAQVVEGDTGEALYVNPLYISSNVNGVTKNRLAFAFKNATTGANFALNTSNIGASQTIIVRFRGKLS